MLLTDLLKESIFEMQIRNYSIRTQKSYKNNNALFHNYIKEKYNILELEYYKLVKAGLRTMEVVEPKLGIKN